jgi:hypothetical protein
MSDGLSGGYSGSARWFAQVHAATLHPVAPLQTGETAIYLGLAIVLAGVCTPRVQRLS